MAPKRRNPAHEVAGLRGIDRAREADRRDDSLSSSIAATPVFDRGVYIGCIVELQNGQHEAGRSNGESLGLYTSPAAAAHALLEAASKGQGRRAR